MPQDTTSLSQGKAQTSWFSRNNQGGRLWTLLLFLPPALCLFTLFVVVPLFEASFFSFYRWNGIGELNNYLGLQNYSKVIGHSAFHTAIGNTLKIVAVSLLIQLPLALSVALCVYKQSWANTVFRLIFFLPYILAEVVAGLIWKFIYDGNYGVVNMFTEFFGLENYFILGDKQWAFAAILIVIIWKYFGFHMMIFIAALQGVPNDLVEAAKIDGATRLQTTFLIKIPLIKHAIILSMFFSILGALQLFDLIIPLTNGGPSHSSHSIVSYLYTFGISRMRIGFGSAIGVLLFIACVVFAFTYQNAFMKDKK
ncbi:sugar ABC transporter permease [Alginatibacterium sediminis]|uniref:Sugar ABC transporter permease n=1 Tax=Alginatibacterium sediminis TaxID=2164068 RepID=A0A420EGF7_9ALTE|nr:sugar ABC transporter permease [Alginatibacterium sediminis]RKF19795.1 sugar ABC transporter permease [Alginatibacterium sediminis]